MEWKIRNRSISFEKPLLMGILNLTPDSFSDGGDYLDPERAFDRALEMVSEGADILDLGAESTRPGAEFVSEAEELKRLLPVLEKLHLKVSVPISVDTTKPEVARACLDRGAHIINDVSGLKSSAKAMAKVVKDYDAGIVLMHRRGDSQTMQSLASYEDVVCEVIRELQESLEIALSEGIHPEQIVLDPGIGFAKDADPNFELVRRIEEFHRLNYPILLGASRKSFIGKITGREACDRDAGTAAIVALAARAGVQIHRVHNVRAMRDVLEVTNAILKTNIEV